MNLFFDETKFYFGLFLLIVAALASVYFFEKATCYSKTDHIGFDRQFGLFSGCLVEVEPNKWIPLESYYFKQD